MNTDDIDQRLRTYAERWRAAQPPVNTAPVADAPHRPARSRPHPLLVAAALAAVVGVAALAVMAVAGRDGERLVAGPPTTADPTDRALVPWIDAPAPPPVPPTTTTAPPLTGPACRAESLAVVDVVVAGAGGHTSTGVRFANSGGAPCSVSGTPPGLSGTVDGRRVAIPAGYPTYFPDPRPGDLLPGDEEIVIIQTDSACEQYPAGGPVYRDVRIEMPGGGLLAVPAIEVNASCGVAVGTVGLADAPRVGLEPRPPAAPGSLAALEAQVESPASARPGQELRFVVTLSNGTDVPVRLVPCPGYRVTLVASGARAEERYLLNCSVIETVPPSGNIRFEIRVRVPEGAEPGTARLGWDMSDWGGPVGGTNFTLTS